MRFRVLGPLDARTPDGRPVPLGGDRQRTVLAMLLARPGAVVSVDELAEAVWGDDQPVNPANAVQNQVSRLRKALGDDVVVTRPPGYVLAADADELDSARFEALVAAARRAEPAEAVRCLEEALGLWRGPAFAEHADVSDLLLAAIRLGEARLTATEDLGEALLAAGRAAEAVPRLEAFVAEFPLRERARAALMRALYATGRATDALAHYRQYREHLAEELGLEPSAALVRLETEIVRHEVVVPGAAPTSATGGAATDAPRTPRLDGLAVSYLKRDDGSRIACAHLGSGPRVVVVPAWMTSLDVIAAGRDPRSSFLERLLPHASLTLYDRRGTGLTRGTVEDWSLQFSVDELHDVVRALDEPVHLLAVSMAGPIAVAYAAQQPDRVRSVVLFGTFASGPETFRNRELRTAIVQMIRNSFGMGTKLMADMYRPGASTEASDHLARVFRESTDADTAAGFLAASYDWDVSDQLESVQCPALVLHYRKDRLIPFWGGEQLASGLPHASFVPLDGRFHLPDAADLDRIESAIAALLRSVG